jgi:hypothetical protein
MNLVRASLIAACATFWLAPAAARAQTAAREPDWRVIEAETLEHYVALLRFDTSDPPGREQPAVDYLRRVLEREGIPVETFGVRPQKDPS